jgi:hypothetical protein
MAGINHDGCVRVVSAVESFRPTYGYKTPVGKKKKKSFFSSLRPSSSLGVCTDEGWNRGGRLDSPIFLLSRMYIYTHPATLQESSRWLPVFSGEPLLPIDDGTTSGFP